MTVLFIDSLKYKVVQVIHLMACNKKKILLKMFFFSFKKLNVFPTKN